MDPKDLAQQQLNQQKEQMMLQQQIEVPKSATGIFTLPCGYLSPDGVLHREIDLREMTGKEEDLLASKKTDSAKKMNELFVRCLVRIGALTERPQIAAAVPELLLGDRTFLMFAIRRVTLGDEYPFKHRCPECEKESLYMVDLSEISIKEMPDPTKRSFDGVLPASGKTFRFHLLCGRDETRLASVEDPEAKMTQAMQMRLDMFDERPVDKAALQALGLKDRNALRERFDEVDGGVDTAVELTCPKCDHDYSTDLDISQSGFFFPSATRKNSKKKSST